MLSIAIALLLAGAAVAGDEGSPKSAKELVGEKAAGILANASKVEVYRIQAHNPEADKDPNNKPAMVEGYDVTLQEKDQGKAFAAELRNVLLDDHTYLWDASKSCKPSPEVALRATAGNAWVTVLLSFDCNLLKVIAHDTDGSETRSRWKDFDPGRATLVKLAKRALPNDPVIRDLKEQK